jgi:hypothetical protein
VWRDRRRRGELPELIVQGQRLRSWPSIAAFRRQHRRRQVASRR